MTRSLRFAIGSLAILLLVVGSQQADAPRWAAAAEEVDAGVRVELMAFSGRPNPSFDLSTDEIETLRELLGEIPERPAPRQEEFAFWPVPGMAGFLIESSGVQGVPGRMRVFNDVITIYRPGGDVLLEDVRGVDSWLVSLARSRVVPEVSQELLDDYESRSFLEEQARHQAAHVLARGLARDGVGVIVGEVAAFRDATQPADDAGAGRTGTVAEIEVIEAVRGDFGSTIEVFNSSGLVRNLRYRGFDPRVVGSRWILLVNRGRGGGRGSAGEVDENTPGENLQAPQGEADLFTVYYHGYGAVCVEWPETVPKRPTQPLAEAGVVDDLKSAVRIRERIDEYRADEALKERLLDGARSPFGRLLLGETLTGNQDAMR